MVTYVAVPEGTLWRCRADGSERLQLTFAPGTRGIASLVADRKAYCLCRCETGQAVEDLRRLSRGGSSQDILPEGRNQIDANWSADGKRIMFGYFVHDTERLNIRIVDLKTHKTVTVPARMGYSVRAGRLMDDILPHYRPISQL